MSDAPPTPQPSRVFRENVGALARTAGEIADAANGRRARPWQAPEPAGWDGDHDDPDGITPPFDRAALVDEYARVAANGGTIGASGAVATQVSWVGACERAYRARHASPLRCMAVASSRRWGHGRPRGVLLGGTIAHVQSLLTAGGAVPSSLALD